ncbi:MAG: hypothetical protein EU548_09045 [Promethearchaeota archaeon]|nr:MAG: hypothetical protein EU548_09045 [Candidatus Lokiarchaeota archaeon]
MKLRLRLKTITKKNKEVSIKFNIAPSKHLGFINFVNLALNQELPVTLSFEKIGKSGAKEESKIEGSFKFTGKDTLALKELSKEIQENGRKSK